MIDKKAAHEDSVSGHSGEGRGPDECDLGVELADAGSADCPKGLDRPVLRSDDFWANSTIVIEDVEVRSVIEDIMQAIVFQNGRATVDKDRMPAAMERQQLMLVVEAINGHIVDNDLAVESAVDLVKLWETLESGQVSVSLDQDYSVTVERMTDSAGASVRGCQERIARTGWVNGTRCQNAMATLRTTPYTTLAPSRFITRIKARRKRKL